MNTTSLPPRSSPITPAPALMPQHLPMSLTIANTTDHETETEPEEITAAAPSPGAAAADDQAEERRARRRRVATVEIPEAVHAIATLTGRDAGEIIEDLLAAQVAGIKATTARILSEALR